MQARALLVGASPDLEPRFLLEHAAEGDRIVAIDGGADVCRHAGLVPDVVVGDLDSISSTTAEWIRAEAVPVDRHEVGKDYSDLDAALSLLVREQIDAPLVFGVIGGRPDHTLAAIGSLARAAELRPVVIEPQSVWWVLSPNARRRVAIRGRGVVFSVIAATTRARVSIEQARYPLSAEWLEPLSALGLSNVTTADPATVTVHEGCAVVIANTPDGGYGAYAD